MQPTGVLYWGALLSELRSAALRFGLNPILLLRRTGSLMNFFIQTLTELDNSLNHVARIVHYIENVPAEAAWDGQGDASLPKDWPSEGKIEFRDAVMTYREDLSPALKGLNANVGAHEKIGIAGRTGSGKSTLMLALFRMYELRSGSILIDGVDIHTLGPHQLRMAHIVVWLLAALWPSCGFVSASRGLLRCLRQVCTVSEKLLPSSRKTPSCSLAQSAAISIPSTLPRTMRCGRHWSAFN